MKKRFKKLTALFLAAAMAMSVAACGSNNGQKEESQAKNTEAVTKTESGAEKEESTKITFPLEEEVTFTFMGADGSGLLGEQVGDTPFFQKMYEKTNVKIEVISLPATDTMSALNGLFASGAEGDVIASGLTDADMQQLAGAGLLQDLSEYVYDADLMPNFNERVLAENERVSSVMSMPDGKVYSLPTYNANKASYVESVMWINKTWLDQLGESIPTTIEDFERVLGLFVANDMNGNGKNDEIGLMVRQGDAYSHFEALLGMWGIPTKDGQYENYVYVKDGKVIFAPVTETWKEAIKTFSRWYAEGLVWDECFTATYDTQDAKIKAEEMTFGVLINKTPPTGHEDDYVRMTPPAVEGYDTSWYIHPGYNGSHVSFAVTRSCENVDILMAWIDELYSFETSLEYQYGDPDAWNWSIKDGVFVNEGVSGEEWEKVFNSSYLPYYLFKLPYAFTQENYAERIEKKGNDLIYDENYATYENILNQEEWPRPYIAEEVSTKLSELRTDIFNTLNVKKAEWITGASDIDADWDAYLASMEAMGVAEFEAMMQQAYDSFMSNLK